MTDEIRDVPFSVAIDVTSAMLRPYDNHVRRYLSAMAGQYQDQAAYAAQIAQEDMLIYEVYETRRPEIAGELPNGMTVLHAGKVGDEYFMTKGHFHAVLETAEVYYTLRGEGMMVLETPEGDWAVEEMRPGRVLYVPSCWAHRTVNTSAKEDLLLFFVYPGHAGHDYGSIEERGFRKLVVERDCKPTIIDNPRWSATEG